MKKILFLALMSTTLFSACVRKCTEYSPDMNYFIFGHFYGFCSGEKCIEIYRLQNNQLHEAVNDHYPRRDSAYQGNYVQLSEQFYLDAKELPAAFPTGLWNEPNTVIGNPDETDGGGLYIEYNYNGLRKFWLIDNNEQKVPIAYHAFMEQVRNIIGRLP